MKYKLFIVTLFVSLSFLDGAPIDDIRNSNEDEIREIVYSSYEATVEKLKANEFDYLTEDIDALYKLIYEILLEIRNFVNENEDLIDEIDDVLDNVYDCLDDSLLDAIVHYEHLIKKLYQTLNESPKTPTCYKDFQIYFNDIKEESKKRFQNNETSEKVESYFENVEEDLEEFERMYDINPHLVFEDEMDEQIEDYIESMVAAKEEKKSETEIKELSAKYIGERKEESDEFLDRFMNKENLKHVLEEYKKIEDSCRQMEKDLSFDTAMMESAILTDIANIERFSTAKVYVLDIENIKVQVECEDHVPYFGAKPAETVISFSMNGDKSSFILEGEDENGRRYKRTIKAEGFDQSVMTVNEVIEYNDMSVANNYIFEFATGGEA